MQLFTSVYSSEEK